MKTNSYKTSSLWSSTQLLRRSQTQRHARVKKIRIMYILIKNVRVSHLHIELFRFNRKESTVIIQQRCWFFSIDCRQQISRATRAIYQLKERYVCFNYQSTFHLFNSLAVPSFLVGTPINEARVRKCKFAFRNHLLVTKRKSLKVKPAVKLFSCGMNCS